MLVGLDCVTQNKLMRLKSSHRTMGSIQSRTQHFEAKQQFFRTKGNIK